LFLRNSNKAKLLSIIASSLAFSFLFWNNILAAEDGRTASIKLNLLSSFTIFGWKVFLY
jgi:hypothetical protein